MEFYGEQVHRLDVEVDRSSTAWRELQLEDPVLQLILPLVESGKKSDVSFCGLEEKPYLQEWDRLCLKDGSLFRSCIDQTQAGKTIS